MDESIFLKNMETETNDEAVAWALNEIKFYIGHIVKYDGPLTISSRKRRERELSPRLGYPGPTTVIRFDISDDQIDPVILEKYISSLRKNGKKKKDGYLIAGASQSPALDNWYFLFVVIRKNGGIFFNCVEEN